MKRVIPIFLLLVAVLWAQTVVPKPPLSKQDIADLMAGGVSDARVVTIIEQRGVSFDADAGYLQELKAAGASDGVTKAIYAASMHREKATAAAVPVDQEPRHHLFLENDYVRVFKVEVAPHDRTLMHQHDRDYAFVVLGDAKIINARQGTPAMEQTLKLGDTAYAKGGFAHVAINQLDTPFRNITIEIKKSQPEPNPEPFVTLAGAGMSVTQLVNNDRIHAELYELAPGAITPPHRHTLPHLAIFLDDVTIENVMDGKKRDDKFTNGDVIWVGNVPFTHTLQNMGAARARWVMIEVK